MMKRFKLYVPGATESLHSQFLDLQGAANDRKCVNSKFRLSASSVCAGLVAAVSVFGISRGAHGAITYNATALGSFTPTGLNASDQVVGYTSANIPVVYSGGLLAPVPGVVTGQARGINASGIVVGSDTTTANGFYYQAGSISTATEVASDISGASMLFNGINDSGTIVGTSKTLSSPNVTQMITYTPLGGTVDVTSTFNSANTSGKGAMGSSINSMGTVAGISVAATGNGPTYNTTLATPKTGSTYSYLQIDPSSFTIATSYPELVDNQGNVAFAGLATGAPFGHFYNATTGNGFISVSGSNTEPLGIADVNGTPVIAGFTGSNAEIYTLNAAGTAFTSTNLSAAVPGYALTAIDGINSNGDLVAVGTPTGGGTQQAFLLTAAVPEPTSIGLLAIGGISLLGCRHRRAAL